MRMRTIFLALALTLIGACAVSADDDPGARALPYDGVCNEPASDVVCQCFEGFLSNYVTRVECDAEGYEICEGIGPHECIDLTP